MLGILLRRGSGDQEPPEEGGFCKRLARRADRHGLAVLLLIPRPAPQSAPGGAGSRPQGVMTAYRLTDGGWERTDGGTPRVDIVYDRYFPRGPGERAAAFALLRSVPGPCLRMNGSLPDKWTVHRVLRRDDAVRPLLPATVPLRGAERLPFLLDRFGGSLVLKPAAGMQGRGIVRLRRLPSGAALADGRDSRNGRLLRQFASDGDGACLQWMRRLTVRPYLAQRLLALHTPERRPFDIRLLVQKDGRGRWRPTGAAARLGRTGGLTANLHGGGDAAEALPFLSGLFGGPTAEALLKRLTDTGLRIAALLESSFGRFAELGLDFGIDTQAGLWFLEANAKPGRSAFAQLGGRAAVLSVERPLQYARYLLNAQTVLPNPPGRSPQSTCNYQDHVQEEHE